MDELEDLLAGLRQQAPPRESLERIGPRVHAALRRRRMTRYVLAAAALLAATIWMIPREAEPVPLPDPIRPVIAVPDLILNAPAPVMLSSHRAKPTPRPRVRIVDEETIELASSNPNVKILWSME